MRTLIDRFKRAIRRAHRDQLAVWACNAIMRTVASPWQRGLVGLTRQRQQVEAMPPELRASIELVLLDYTDRFAGCEEWPGVDANLEELAWVYNRLTGWDADNPAGGQT